MTDVFDSHLKEINTQGEGCREGRMGPAAAAPGTGLADEAVGGVMAVPSSSQAHRPLWGGSSVEGGCSLLAWLRAGGCCAGTPFLCRQQAKFGIALLSCSQIFSPPLTHFSKLQGLSVRSGSPWAGKRGTELCSLEQAPYILSSVKT